MNAHPALDTSPTAAKSLPSLRSTAPRPRLSRFPKCALRCCSRSLVTTGESGNENIVNSRGAGKRDDIVAERANPRNAQLGDRDAFTFRYGRQGVHELEIMPDVLRPRGWVSKDDREA